VRDFIAAAPSIRVRLHVTVGELEEFDPTPAVARASFGSSFFKLGGLLSSANLPELHCSFEVLHGETHASAWPLSFSRGIRAVYSASNPPLF
jgi:hypothetical protein